MRILSLLLLPALAFAGADAARALLEKDDAQGAEKAAREIVAGAPEDVAAWLVLADALVAQDLPADAWEALEGAIARNPKEARLSLKLGDVFVKLAEREAGGGGSSATVMNYYFDAERNYGEALEKDPKCADALYGMANANFSMGTDAGKEKAKKLLADCLALDGKHGKAHALQGYMLYLDKKYPEAQLKYETALSLDDSSPLDFVRYGHTFIAQGKWDEAKKAYLAGLKRHPASDLPIRSGLYHVAPHGQGKPSWNHPNLRALLEEVVKEAPRSAPAWYYLGYCHFLAEAWPDALAAYGKAHELDPKNATYMYHAGYAHEKMGDAEKAIDFYRRALLANPDHVDSAMRFEGLVIVKAADIDRAEKLYEELIKLVPGNADIHNNYALVLRDWAEGTRTATGKDPPAEVRRRLKRSGEVYEMAAALAGDSPQIQSDTGLLFEFYPCNFDAQKAKRYFIRSLELSDFAYRDAFDGLDRLCRKTADWQTLANYAERVIGSMERGNHAIAPVAAGPPQPLPNETPGLRARAEAALKLARERLKKE